MTRIIKLGISIFFYIFLQMKFLIIKIFKLNSHPRCVILYYHSIYKNEIETFKRHMELIKRKTNVIKSDHFGNLESSILYSIITFDDGFENLIDNAIPTLIINELPFTVFFISNLFGKKPNWDFPTGHRDMNEKIMTTEQMKSIPANLLTVGSHTANHRKLNTLSENELILELDESKRVLEKVAEREVSLIAFPNGEYNNIVVQKSLEYGYKRVFTIEPKFSLQSPDEKVTGRVWVNGYDWFIEFWLKVHGGYCWLNSAFNFKRKLLK